MFNKFQPTKYSKYGLRSRDSVYLCTPTRTPDTMSQTDQNSNRKQGK